MELPTLHKFDIDTFFRMAEVGIIGESDRIELIDGALIDMAPTGQDHAGMVNVLTETVVLTCAGSAIVAMQNPVRLSSHDMPQPDFVIYRRRDDYYRTGEHPGHRQPSSSGYKEMSTMAAGARLGLCAAPDIILDLQRIFG